MMNNMNDLQKQYEAYMKTVTDGFARLCNYDGAESVLAGEGNRVSVMIYQYQEYLLSYDKDLLNMYYNDRMTSEERTQKFHLKKQESAEKFLKENSLTYNEWLVKFKLVNKYRCGECGWVGTVSEMKNEQDVEYDQDCCPECNDVLFDNIHNKTYCDKV